jgi:hypothetical protein
MTTDDARPDEQQQEPQEPSTRDAIASARRSLELQSGTAWLINWCAHVELDLRRDALAAAQSAAQSAARGPEHDAQQDGA